MTKRWLKNLPLIKWGGAATSNLVAIQLKTPAWGRVPRLGSMVVFLVVLMLLWAKIPFLLAEAKANIQYKYYPVKVTTADKIVNEYFAASPIKIGTKRFMGKASWSITYRTKVIVNDKMCEIVEALVTNNCLITLPRVEVKEPIFKYLLDGHVNRLKTHELIHCRIATEYAAKLDEKLLKLGRIKCEDVKAKTQVEYQSILDECRSTQIRFDEASNHGHNDGVDLGLLLAPYLDSAKLLPAPASENLPLGNVRDIEESSGIYQDKDGVWRNY